MVWQFFIFCYFILIATRVNLHHNLMMGESKKFIFPELDFMNGKFIYGQHVSVTLNQTLLILECCSTRLSFGCA